MKKKKDINISYFINMKNKHYISGVVASNTTLFFNTDMINYTIIEFVT